MSFDDINLGDGELDDTNAPKIDLSFDDAGNNKSSGFSFTGGWGGWGSGSRWDFSGAGDAGNSNKAEDDAAKHTSADTGLWGSFGKKNKKKENGGFDFSFDNTTEEAANAEPPTEADPTAQDDSWGYSASSKDKKKKNKRGTIVEEGLPEPPIVVIPEPEPEAPAFDSAWGGGWGTTNSKKDKKKKGGAINTFEEPAPPPPPPPPIVLEEPPVAMGDDDWGFASTKKGKKGKKGKEEPAFVPEPEPIVVVVPEAEPEAVNDDAHWGGWGAATSKRDKKKKGQNGSATGPTPFADDPIVSMIEPETTAEANTAPANEDWMDWGTSKKDKKKPKRGAAIEEVQQPPPPPVIPEAIPEPTNDWGTSSFWGSGKKDKKSKNGRNAFTEPEPVPPADQDPLMDLLGDKTIKPDGFDEPRAEGEDDWGGGWGFNKKDKKKGNSRNAPVEVIDVNPAIAEIQKPDSITESKSTVEDDNWGGSLWGSAKNKKKGKKGAIAFDAPPPVPTPPEEPGMINLALSPPPPVASTKAIEAPNDDMWGSYGTTTKKGKKDKKGSSTTKASQIDEAGLSKQWSRESPNDIVHIIDDAPPANPIMVEDSPKEEVPASQVRSMWGSWGNGSTSKTKTTKEKEKEKKDKEAKEKMEQEEKEKTEKEEAKRLKKGAKGADMAKLSDDPVVDIIDETPAKGKKNKGTAKTETKSGKKSATTTTDEDLLAAIADTPAEDPVIADILEETKPKKDDKRGDTSWGGSFWGVSLKSTKKSTAESKKDAAESANHNASLMNASQKFPEPIIADQSPPPLKAAKSSSASKGTTVVKGSVADRIKALQSDKKGHVEPAPPPPPPLVDLGFDLDPDFEPLSEQPQKPSASSKKNTGASKVTSKSSSKKKDKDSSPPLDPIVDLPKARSPVPGGFPLDDEIVEVIEASAMADKAYKKSAKANRKTTKSTKAEAVVDVPPPPFMPNTSHKSKSKSAAEERSKLPTPPPEPEVLTDAPSPRKERAKVVRSQGASSWGFWGAAPKQEPRKKSKDDSPTNSKPSTPGLVRSKSARKASDKDTEGLSKSSGSDKAAKTPSRPKSSRGTSFSLFGGAPPSRSRSMRAPKSSSRRASVDPDTGMMSPPEDEKVIRVSAKAAKVMGIGTSRPSVGRSGSTREKGKSRGTIHASAPKSFADAQSTGVPDPYAIDDDIVLVRGAADMVDMPAPKLSRNRSLPKDAGANRTSKRDSRISDGVLVDTDGPTDGAEVVTGPDDMAFVEAPRRTPLKRSASSAKKSDGFMGLFGLSRRNTTRESDDRGARREVQDNEDGVSRHKRGSVRYEDESAKRPRRSRRVSDTDGFMTDAMPASTDVEDPEARRARRARRAERERDSAAAEEKAARRREREREKEREAHETRKVKAREVRDRRLREEQELEARRQEEKRARRATREQRRAQEEQARREDEAREAEYHARRRERERDRETAGADDPRSRPSNSDRPRTSRRQSHVDGPTRASEHDAARRQRHDERRPRYSTTHTPAERSARPVEDYFDPCNGHSQHDAPQTAPARPYLASGDKTASWVNSFHAEPPLPPPVEGTVLEGAPDLNGGDTTADEEARRDTRRIRPGGAGGSRKQGSYREEGRRDGRREERRVGAEGFRSSDGSGAGERIVRRKSAFPSLADGGTRAWDERPAGPGKRGSWFKKFTGL